MRRKKSAVLFTATHRHLITQQIPERGRFQPHTLLYTLCHYLGRIPLSLKIKLGFVERRRSMIILLRRLTGSVVQHLSHRQNLFVYPRLRRTLVPYRAGFLEAPNSAIDPQEMLLMYNRRQAPGRREIVRLPRKVKPSSHPLVGTHNTVRDT